MINNLHVSVLQDSDSGSGSSGAAIGGAVGGILFIIIVVIISLVVIYYVRHLHKRKAHSSEGDVTVAIACNIRYLCA